MNCILILDAPVECDRNVKATLDGIEQFGFRKVIKISKLSRLDNAVD